MNIGHEVRISSMKGGAVNDDQKSIEEGFNNLQM